MNNTSPFSFLESIATRFQPPAWMVDEGQQRLVLFLNHVLMQEKQAQNRLLRQKGRVVHLKWGLFAIDLVVTPAGLVDRAPPFTKPDLLLSVTAESSMVVVRSVLSGKAPPVKIEGDVQLAAELGWLAENLRWDVEEDLSRLIGDAPAHALADMGRRVATGLKQFLAQEPLSPTVASSSTVAVPVPERSAAPSASSSFTSGSNAACQATSVEATEGSAGLSQAGSVPPGSSDINEVKNVEKPPTPGNPA